jgi:Flp pilus assembly pilin Flp
MEDGQAKEQTMSIRDHALSLQIQALHQADRLAGYVRRRLVQLRDDEKGQTPTEYLMIVGLMAAAIVTIFVTFFWGTIRGAATSWAGKVRDAVSGMGMQ